MNNTRKISYGTIIKNLRKSNKLSQTELGKLVGVSKSSISAYELETAIPNIQTFIDICKVCHSKITITFDNHNYELEKLSREF